jgi:aminoglycoside 2'-N-acetyltransferase I
MLEVRTSHTSSLDAAALDELRRFLDEAFSGDFDDEDWDHALGGIHAVGTEDGALVAHASVVQRRLLHGGRALRTGYVEAVAVRADRRRRGYGRAVMERLGEVIRGAYEVGGLAAGEPAATLYRSLGWRAWEGDTWVLGPHGLERTPEDDGGIYVLPVAAKLDLAGNLACDWRGGAVW